MNFKLSAFLFFISFTALAQGGANSIYSQYGLGLSYPHQFSRSFGMANTGIALSDPLTLNLYNPASISDIKYTTFDINGTLNAFISKDGVNTPASALDGSLGTIGLGTPLLKNWGAMVGLTPYSSMGYSVDSKGTDVNAGTYTDHYKGYGGINQIFFATAYRYKNFAVGAKANYLFGTINQQKLRVIDALGYFNAYENQEYKLFDFTFDFGAQYHYKANDNLNFTLGAVYGLQQDLSAKYSLLSFLTTQTYISDPMSSGSIQAGTQNTTTSPTTITLSIPSYYGGGLAMKYKEKLTVTIDYKQQDWRLFQLNAGSYTVGKNYNIGAEYIPNKNSVGSENYHKRIAYRFGISYQNTPLMINGVNITDYSASLGFSFPLRKFKYERELFGSTLNLALQVGRRGSLSNNLVQDDYIKVNFGFTLNDKWYIKRKFD